MRDTFYGTSGSQDAPIVLVGESWGIEEAQAKRPFVGQSGQELRRMLAEANLDESQILFTNLIAEKPQSNETWRFFIPKEQKPNRIGGLAPSPQVRDEVRRLFQQIKTHPRKLIITAGAWSTWALTQTMGSKAISQSNNRPVPTDLQTWGPTGILSWRGSMIYCNPYAELGLLPTTPLLPLIHPAAILREWYLRSPTVHDLKTRVPMALEDRWRPAKEPTILATPSFREAIDVLDNWIATTKPIDIAADCETIQPNLTCFGFAESTSFALVVPFIRIENDFITSYWTIEEETQIVLRLRRLLTHPLIRIIGQNFIYDTQYAQHWWGVTPRLDFDTMLAQNVLFPGTPKDLGYLASLYCEHYWYWKDDAKFWSAKEIRTPELLKTHLLYNGWDCLRTWEVAQSQMQLIEHLNMKDQMALKMKINNLCLRMMNRGIKIDTKRRNGLRQELLEVNQVIASEIEEILPQAEVNPDPKVARWYNSDKQTKHVFHEMLGFKVVKNPKTGKPTTGKQAFGQFKQWYPEFNGLFSRMQLLGTLENSANVINMKLSPDNRAHCSFNPGGTETHRLSSSESAFGLGTNLQNLTKGKEDE